MKSLTQLISSALLLSALAVGCAKSSNSSNPPSDPVKPDAGSSNPNNPPKANQLDVTTIPPEFNPTERVIKITNAATEKFSLNIFDFAEDVSVTYASDITPGTGILKFYTVSKGSVKYSSISVNNIDKEFSFRGDGDYQCSINIQNGKITDLNGLCYIKIVVILPVDSQIEVYNLGKILTKRFRPVDTNTFLKSVDRAPFDADKLALVDDYVNSYNGAISRPALTAKQLGAVIHGFMETDNKFKVLQSLCPYVTDRQNLNSMIENVFFYGERDEARRIAGI